MTTLISRLRKKDNEKLHPSREYTSYEHMFNRNDFVYEPKNRIFIAKERTHFVNEWGEGHKALHAEHARMITMREFIDFLLLLRSEEVRDGYGEKLTKSERETIFYAITEPRDSSGIRAEFLDAHVRIHYKSHSSCGITYAYEVSSNHVTIDGKLTPLRTQTLGLPVDSGLVDITDFDRNGFPIKKIDIKGFSTEQTLEMKCPEPQTRERVLEFDISSGYSPAVAFIAAYGSNAKTHLMFVRHKKSPFRSGPQEGFFTDYWESFHPRTGVRAVYDV